MNLTINLEEHVRKTNGGRFGFSRFTDIRSIKFECNQTLNKNMWSLEMLLFIGDRYIKQLITLEAIAFETALDIIKALSALIYGYKFKGINVDGKEYPEVENLWKRKEDIPFEVLSEKHNVTNTITIINDRRGITISVHGKAWTWCKVDNPIETIVSWDKNIEIHKTTGGIFTQILSEKNIDMSEYCEKLYVAYPSRINKLNAVIDGTTLFDNYSIIFNYDKSNEKDFLTKLPLFMKHKQDNSKVDSISVVCDYEIPSTDKIAIVVVMQMKHEEIYFK